MADKYGFPTPDEHDAWKKDNYKYGTYSGTPYNTGSQSYNDVMKEAYQKQLVEQLFTQKKMFNLYDKKQIGLLD
jgi:hypothetical protein